MKLIKKNYKFVLGILIGVLLGSIGVYAGTLMNSNEVTFTPQNNKWNVTKVDEALNSLYSVAVPEEYSGTTSVTPTYSDITLNTQDKLLKNNITISGIPSTYKNLTSTTTVTADKLLSGETAYNSDGNLITGTLQNNSQGTISNLTYIDTVYSGKNQTSSSQRVTISKELPTGKYLITINSSFNTTATEPFSINTDEQLTGCDKTEILPGGYRYAPFKNKNNIYLLNYFHQEICEINQESSIISTSEGTVEQFNILMTIYKI